MQCDKCNTGTMAAISIFRFSGCLVAIGFSLLIPALFALLGVTILGIGSCVAGGKATADTHEQIKADTATELRKIPGLSPEVVIEFEENGRISLTTKDSLPESQREAVERIMSSHAAMVGGATLGGAVVGGIGGILMVVTYVAGIPAFIVGLVLILRKKVWRCGHCGYIFDRA